MKKRVFALIKKCFLFYILFNFFSLAATFFLSATLDVLTNIRVFDLSFYRLQPVDIQIILLLMNLYILVIVAIRYFRLLLSFINTEEKENNYYEAEIERQKVYKKEKTFNMQIKFIVMCIIFSIIFSFIVQFLGIFNRY